MKNKLFFILPRFIALTLIVGLASLILGIVFKLLLGVLVLGTMALGVATLVQKLGRHHRQGQMDVMLPVNRQHYASSYESHYQSASSKTIIPID